VITYFLPGAGAPAAHIQRSSIIVFSSPSTCVSWRNPAMMLSTVWERQGIYIALDAVDQLDPRSGPPSYGNREAAETPPQVKAYFANCSY